MLSVLEEIKNVEHVYAKEGTYQLRITDQLSSLSACTANPTATTKLKESLVAVRSLGSNIVELPDKSFYNCTKLSVANGTENLKSIGVSCFADCTSLSSSNLLDGSLGANIDLINDCAFKNTAFETAVIGIRGGSNNSVSRMGDEAFANCTSLKKVKFTSSNYMGDRAFENCTALEDVQFNNRYSYMGNQCFKGCTSLQKISIPQYFHLTTSEMFKDCTSLTSVEFADTAEEPSHFGAVGPWSFNSCTALTSLTLPSSINNILNIDDEAFKGSSLKRIRFMGLDDDAFSSSKQSETKITLDTGKWIGDYGLTSITAEQKDDILLTVKTIFKDGIDTLFETPIVLIFSNTSGCSNCKSLERNVLSTPEFDAYQKKSPYIWIFIDASNSTKTNMNALYHSVWAYIKSIYTSANLSKEFKRIDEQYSAWPAIIMFHKSLPSENGYAKVFDGIQATKQKDFFDTISTAFKAYHGKGYDTDSDDAKNMTIRKSITGWGLSNDCEFISKSGTVFQWKYSESHDYALTYTPPTRVDEVTVNNFKYGIWYYNAKELVAYADSKNIPIVVEVGSIQSGCTPCIQFDNNVFKNENVQKYVASKPMLLGHVDYSLIEEPQAKYVVENLCKMSINAFAPPQVVLHWKKTDGSVINIVKHYDETDYQPGYIRDANELTTLIEQTFAGATDMQECHAPEISTVSQDYRPDGSIETVPLTSDFSFKTNATIYNLSSSTGYKTGQKYYKALKGSVMTSVTADVGNADVSVHCECKDTSIQVNGLSVTYVDILGKKNAKASSITDYKNINPLSAWVVHEEVKAQAYDVPRIKHYCQTVASGEPTFANDLSGVYFVCDTKTEDSIGSYSIPTYNGSFGSNIIVSAYTSFSQPLASSIYPYKQGWYLYYTTPISETYYDKEGILFKTDNFTHTTSLSANHYNDSEGMTVTKLSSSAETSAVYGTLGSAQEDPTKTKTYTDEQMEAYGYDYNKSVTYNCTDPAYMINGKMITAIVLQMLNSHVIHAYCSNVHNGHGVAKLYKFTNKSSYSPI